jgi:hypothetical protein
VDTTYRAHPAPSSAEAVLLTSADDWPQADCARNALEEALGTLGLAADYQVSVRRTIRSPRSWFYGVYPKRADGKPVAPTRAALAVVRQLRPS